MSILAPLPDDPADRYLADAAGLYVIVDRLVRLLVCAWADGAYEDARDDVRTVMLQLQTESRRARERGDLHETGGCERARDRLNAVWAEATDKILCTETGLPQWDGVVDRLHDEEPAASIDDPDEGY